VLIIQSKNSHPLQNIKDDGTDTLVGKRVLLVFCMNVKRALSPFTSEGMTTSWKRRSRESICA